MFGSVGSHYELCDYGLYEAGWLLGRCFGYAEQALTKGRLGCYPAQARARSDSLGERIEADDATLVVNG